MKKNEEKVTNQKFYICCCSFPGENTTYIQAFDNPEAAIECDTKEIENHCEWHAIISQKVHDKVEHDDGIPMSMWSEHDK